MEDVEEVKDLKPASVGPTTVDRATLAKASAEVKRVKEEPPIRPNLNPRSTRVVGEKH